MKISNIDEYKNGWFVGDFDPSIFKNPFFEIGHHKHKANEETFSHTHKVTTELNYIVSGELSIKAPDRHYMKRQILTAGDMWIYHANDISDVEFVTDVELIVVRWPSVPSDKYLSNE